MDQGFLVFLVLGFTSPATDSYSDMKLKHVLLELLVLPGYPGNSFLERWRIETDGVSGL
jgi:hypothetical protein